MATAEENGVWQQGGTNEQSPGSFWAVKFMGADADEIGVELMDIGEGFLAEPLGGIRMEQNAARTAEHTQFCHGLEGANFIVGGHDRDEDCVRAQCLLEGFHRNAAFCINRQHCEFKALVFCEVFEAMQDRVMLDGRGDQVAPFVAEQARGAEDGEVGGFRAAAGEDHFAGFATKDVCGAIPCVIQQCPGAPANVVNA